MIKKLFLMMFSFLLVFSLTSCKEDKAKKPSKYVHYMDYSKIVDKDIESSIEVSCNETDMQLYDLRINFRVKNLTNKHQTITIDNFKLYDEDSKEEFEIYPYSLENFYVFELDPLKSSFVSLFATLPTSIKDNNYSFTLNTPTKYHYYLRNTPLELREKHLVEFYIDGKCVHKENVPDNTRINPYIWESDDFKEYSAYWYTNLYRLEEFNFHKNIKEDLKIYGIKRNIYDYYLSDDEIQICKVNHEPSNHILVVPNSYNNCKKISISSDIFENLLNIKEVYLPKSLVYLSIYNFTNMPKLETIYYGGSLDEFLEILDGFTSELPFKDVKIVFNTEFKGF